MSTLEISHAELDALVEWHMEQECAAASKGDYLVANSHQQRRETLRRWMGRTGVPVQASIAPEPADSNR